MKYGECLNLHLSLTDEDFYENRLELMYQNLKDIKFNEICYYNVHDHDYYDYPYYKQGF